MTVSSFFRRFFSENSVLIYGLYSRAAYDGARTVFAMAKNLFIYISMVARVSKDRLRCKSTTNFGEDDEKLQ